MLALTVNPKKKKSLMIKEIDVPKVGKNDVLVKLKTSALNHRDLYLNNEWSYAIDWKELIAGGDGAGTIVEVGSEVSNWSVGDQVVANPLLGEEDSDEFPGFLGGPNDGTFSEYLSINQDRVIKKPAYLTFTEAAAVPLALSTAWGTVMKKGKIQEGETVLLQGIGGGVALFILQLALSVGAKVIVTSGSDEKISKALELGAFAGINYKTEDVVKRTLELTNGKGADVVIDSSGKDSIENSVGSLAQNGRLLYFGSTTGPIKRTQVENVNFISTGMVGQNDLIEAFEYYEARKLKPILSEKIYTLDTIFEAYKELEEAKQFGKIVVKIEQDVE